mgnify:CR=1 FL=1
MAVIRFVRQDDLLEIAEIMHNALEPYYGGDHKAHAKRIVETASSQQEDSKGHFSHSQIMYVAEEDGKIIGLLNFVVKYQGTIKISPLILISEARGRGISKLLMAKVQDYAEKYKVRHIYCTVAEKNELALSYFLNNGFINAGKAINHYRLDMNEIMLYKVVQHEKEYIEERTISVVPMEESDKDKVRTLILDRLTSYFNGVDDRWVDALFEGYARKGSLDPNEKYKIIWVAKTNKGEVLGVVAATPKKGDPIKLMPMIACNIQAFSAFLIDLPHILREYGHKVYTHTVPTSIEVETLQYYGWNLEAMMPEAYKEGITTQQWGLVLEGEIMKNMRVKFKYFKAIISGEKPLEVRVGYDSIKKIKPGDNIKLECGKESRIVKVKDVRIYNSFKKMLENEEASHIVPDNPAEALAILQGIYSPNKEKLGVYVLEVNPV